MKVPYVGQRVIFNTLVRAGDFKGEITSVDDLDPKYCTVKIDNQKDPIKHVLYFKDEPAIVSSANWNVCWPEPDPEPHFIVIQCKDKEVADEALRSIKRELSGDHDFGTREAHYVAADVAEDASRITVMVLDPEGE